MRDFRDAKAMARAIRSMLAAKGVKTTIGESLELIAKAFGVADWNTLAAMIRAERGDGPKGRSAPPALREALRRFAESIDSPDWNAILTRLSSDPGQPGGPPGPDVSAPEAARSREQQGGGAVFFSQVLEATLHRAVALAAERKHQYSTLEHLLVALTDDPDAARVMDACRLDIGALKDASTRYVDHELGSLVSEQQLDHGPATTAGVQRVIQRSVIHVKSSGRAEVTGANILVALFSEPESSACGFLKGQGLTRLDAVSFIAHGIRKDGSQAA